MASYQTPAQRAAAAARQTSTTATMGFVARAPEYDPFAVGAGYVAGSEYDPQAEEAQPDPQSPNMPGARERQQRQFQEQAETVRRDALDETAGRLGYESGEALEADIRRGLEANELERRLQEEESARADAEFLEQEHAKLNEENCKAFVRNFVANLNRVLARERDAAAALSEFLTRYPELFYDMVGVPTEEKIRAHVALTIQVYGRAHVKFRDSDLTRLYLAAAAFDDATLQANVQREAVLRMESGGDEWSGCWAKYKAALASQPPPKKGSGKKVALALLGAYLLGVF